MMGARERTKGAEGERQVVRIFRQHGWPDVHRTSNGRTQHGRNDLGNGPAGCAFEVKWQRRLNVPKAFDQLTRDADTLDIPVLVHRPDRHVWMATLPLDELLPLLALRERA
jgi:hypothetical protein